MRSVVADASVLVEYLFRTPRGSTIARMFEAPDTAVHVPALCDVEVASVVRRALNGKRLSETRASEAIQDYLELPIARHGHSALLGRMLQLRENFAAYDATYVALAERLNAELVTTDGALARAVLAHTDVVVL
ncbi:MAG: type II toxin-antitoxin system VapC family toxin [Gemmatimonadaceae bacterium]